MQVAAGGSAFCDKGRYLRVTRHSELLGRAPAAPAGEQKGPPAPRSCGTAH